MISRVLSVENGEKDDKGITIEHLHKLNPKNVSAWNMKRLTNIIRHGALSTLDEQIQDSTQEDESATQIRSEYEAKVAASKIFQNVAKPGSKYIYLEDIERFLPEDEALKTMSLFEGASESRRISKKALKNWVWLLGLEDYAYKVPHLQSFSLEKTTHCQAVYSIAAERRMGWRVVRQRSSWGDCASTQGAGQLCLLDRRNLFRVFLTRIFTR
ncbi:hypothetical protein PVK06_048969 [Gossypium arboreum]|uniref:Uncharacterized protein n=1 Tax=Gossypium arboreum TaxID=29729 RepID=A0ABR0MHH2_GOSAR|nr:hypothetical protein PVK06_048969 [Gossypium arboreum]